MSSLCDESSRKREKKIYGKKTHSHKFTEVEHGKKEHTAENLEKKRASEQLHSEFFKSK